MYWFVCLYMMKPALIFYSEFNQKEEDGMSFYRGGGGFALIVVLFILLIIIGTAYVW